jgi:hypothetical protein
MGLAHNRLRAVYEIQVQGELDQGWQRWFDGVTVALTGSGEGPPVTTLAGPIADQAALRGMLCKLWDLNLTLLSVRRVETGAHRGHQDG